MSNLLEKMRLCWWDRSYKKIWRASSFKDSVTFSTPTEEAADNLVGFIRGNIAPKDGCIALDMGCGNGALGKKIFKNASFLAQTDYFFDAVNLVKSGLSSDEDSAVLQSAAGALPFKEEAFDHILAYSVIHYSGSVNRAVGWVADLMPSLKRGGTLYIGDVPMKRELSKELWRRFKKVRSLNHLKYFFAEFMQVSFKAGDFAAMDDIGEVSIIPQPDYLRFSAWRADVLIRKK